MSGQDFCVHVRQRLFLSSLLTGRRGMLDFEDSANEQGVEAGGFAQTQIQTQTPDQDSQGGLGRHLSLMITFLLGHGLFSVHHPSLPGRRFFFIEPQIRKVKQPTTMASSTDLDKINIPLPRPFNPPAFANPSTIISLFQLSLWLPPAICSLTLGSNIPRQKISHLKKPPKPDEDFKNLNRFYLFLSLFGSFFFQAILWNAVQSRLLVSSNDNSISNLYWVWLIRPLPATFVLFMSYICPSLYLENALEMQFVEGVTGMLTIGIYDKIRLAVAQVKDVSVSQRAGFQYIKHGADLGFGVLDHLRRLGFGCCARAGGWPEGEDSS